jgi:hypothetical protein
MKTIYAGLPFYDSLTKQEKNRTNSKIPFYCPTTHLPPFQICDVIADIPSSFDFVLVDCDGVETQITSYFTATAEIISLTDYFYIIYDGAALSTELPKGTYFLRVYASTGTLYYSEHFTVVDMSIGSWCKIECSNTKDLGNILYATAGFEEVYYLNTQLNWPINETVEVGEEKDGEFITEKLVTKYLLRISDYVNRALHRCLMRLSQHDTITITDEVGNTYTPDVGNLIVTAEPAAFELMKVTIQFNDGANTAFKWTYNMANMT